MNRPILHGLLMATFAALAAPATAQTDGKANAEPLFFTVSTRAWLGNWATWDARQPGDVCGGLPNCNLPGTAESAESTSNHAIMIPALSLRWGAWLLSGSYAVAPRYAFELRDRFYTGKRSEWDLAAGYYLYPSAAITVGWKSIAQNFEGPEDNYDYRGLTVGFTGSARISNSVSIYGNAAFGVPGLFRARVADQTRDALGRTDFDQTYYVTEFGLAYPLDVGGSGALKGMVASVGYRSQVATIKQYRVGREGNTSFPTSLQDNTHGFVFGLSATF